MTDIRRLSKLAHRHRLPLIIDNTVATACLVRPIKLGADIVVNSSSKYINGSSNAISGVLTDSGLILSLQDGNIWCSMHFGSKVFHLCFRYISKE